MLGRCALLASTACAAASAVPRGPSISATPHDSAPPPAVLDLARPAALAAEQQEHGEIADADLDFRGWIETSSSVAFVSYYDRRVLDSGSRWCWVDRARARAGCARFGVTTLATALHAWSAGNARPSDDAYLVLASQLASGRIVGGAHLEHRDEIVRIAYDTERYDEAVGTRRRKVQVRVTAAGDVVTAEAVEARGAPPPKGVMRFEGALPFHGYAAEASLAPLRARSDAFARCFAHEADEYPIVSADIALDDTGRVMVLAGWGTRVSIDTATCAHDLIRSTVFASGADRAFSVMISRGSE